ncbi:MAG: GNAT family N-acetyltransferase [Chloroflexi bacterium]|nr:GNAT family N-acetyltransferase [Chloroflexota bacterium]
MSSTSKRVNAPEGIEVRQLKDGEFEPFFRAVDFGFGNDTPQSRIDQERRIFEDDRAFVALDGDQIVGTTAAESVPMTVPGGAAVPTAGIAYVGVKPTHRRRGILRAMMDRQLGESRERGDVLAALWPSETPIYGRFGFGMAVPMEHWSIPRSHAEFREAVDFPGRLTIMNPADALPHLQHAYEAARLVWPGMLSRGTDWWGFLLADPEHERHDATPKIHTVYRDGDACEGYVTYRINPKDGPSLEIEELVWATAAAHRALWNYCLSVDLMETIRYWNLPPDDPLPWMLHDSRRLRREPTDGVWIKLMDVRAALAARTYSAEGRIVIRVHDEVSGWNDESYELEAGSDGASCAATNKTPDIELSAADLAAAYLGGVSFTNLLAARRVDETTSGALERADRMFIGERMPWCPEEF